MKQTSRTDRYLINFGKTAGIVEPSQRTFNNPPFWQNLPLGLDASRNIKAKAQLSGDILLKGFSVPCIGIEALIGGIRTRCCTTG